MFAFYGKFKFPWIANIVTRQRTVSILMKVNNNIETGTGILIFQAIPNMFWCLLAVSQGFLPLSHRAYSENSETMSNCVKFSDFHEK